MLYYTRFVVIHSLRMPYLYLAILHSTSVLLLFMTLSTQYLTFPQLCRENLLFHAFCRKIYFSPGPSLFCEIFDILPYLYVYIFFVTIGGHKYTNKKRTERGA